MITTERAKNLEAIIAEKDAEIERLEAFFDGLHMVKQTDLLEEQKGTITALNISLGGEDSTSTENLIDAYEVDYAEEGLIPLVRKLTAENVRLEDVVNFQKKAWTAEHEEFTERIAYLEASPLSEEVVDILRSQIAKQSAALKLAREALTDWLTTDLDEQKCYKALDAIDALGENNAT